MTAEQHEDHEPSAIDLALRELLVGDSRVKIDPATGQVVSEANDKTSLTDSQDPNTIG